MTLETSNFNQQIPVFEPVQIFDGVAPTLPRYVGTTLTFADTGAPLWRIQKFWDVSGVTVSGFASGGSQQFKYIWNARATYTYK